MKSMIDSFAEMASQYAPGNNNEWKEESKKNFVRIGGEPFELTVNPISGQTSFQKRSRVYLAEKFGKEFIHLTPDLKGFVNEPSFDNYRPVVDGYANLFPAPPHTPDPTNGEAVKGNPQRISTWMKLIRQVFGEESAALGVEYLSWIVKRPRQMLPVLVLVSRENHTGKTTFLNALRLLLGHAMSFATFDDLNSQFNSYARSLVVGFEEMGRTKGCMDKLKNLSTARHMRINEKHMPLADVESFLKIVICSNNIETCIKATEKDIRWWVRELKPLEQFDAYFEDKLEAEAHDFLDFLYTQPLREPDSRMVFHPNEIRTEAYERILRHSMTDCAQELTAWIDENTAQFGSFLADPSEIRRDLSYRYELRQIRHALKEELKLRPSETAVRYTSRQGIALKGRPYSFAPGC